MSRTIIVAERESDKTDVNRMDSLAIYSVLMVTALFSLVSRSAFVIKDMLESFVIKSLIHVGRIHVSIWDYARPLMMGKF